MNTTDIAVTEGRMKQAWKNSVVPLARQESTRIVEREVDKLKIRTGVITKFYPYLDKAEVQLDNVNAKVLCKILHRFAGDMIDFYTPLEHEKIFDDVLKEPCIIPKAAQHVLIVNIHDEDSEENLILGYYLNDEIVGFYPASPGNVKIMSLTESNSYWVEFGRDGLDIRLPSEMKSKVGSLKKDMKPVTYAKSDEVYGKDEGYNKSEVYPKTDVYTKGEVDEKINNIPHGGDLEGYVKKSDVDIEVSLEDNGTIAFKLDLGDGF